VVSWVHEVVGTWDGGGGRHVVVGLVGLVWKGYEDGIGLLFAGTGEFSCGD
jgi:hypothetical protein